jgi:biopolymer transport protein ExbD
MAGSARQRGLIAEINVTPLVDIMLVLLIVFMLTANLIVKQAIEIELPHASQGTTAKPTQLAIAITRDGALYLNEAPVTADGLRGAVRAAVAADPKTRVTIAGDKSVSYGRVVWIFDLVKSLGISAFAIQIDAALVTPPTVP